MDFNDTTAEAAFRAEARAWIQANAPKHLYEALSSSTFGGMNTGSEDPWQPRRRCRRKRRKPGGAGCRGHRD